jgi:predicted dehydrogenase
MLRSVMGDAAPADAVRAYQVLTGLASHSFSAMRELLGPPKAVTAARQHRGENVIVLFDYETFTCAYEAVIHDVARFDSGIEVLTLNQHFRMNYDTPYIRNLPTRLEITSSTDTETGTEIIGPIYEDPFRIELDAFHESITTGAKPKTTLADSLADLELFAEVGAQFLR